MIKKIFKKILSFILILISIGLICVQGFLGYLIAVIEDTPRTNLNEFRSLPETSYIYDSSDNILDEVPTTEKRVYVESENIPQFLKDAYISTEDRRFYEHSGVDYRRFIGAIIATIKTLFHGEGNIEGGSTITQQLVKNIMLTPDRTIKRKIQEMILSTFITEHMSKDDTLTLYLNTIFLGGSANGVEMASLQYFGKHASELSLLESAFMAGITQSPNYYYPFSENNMKDPSKYINRTETVLDSMLLMGKIDETEHKNTVEDLHNSKLVFKEQEPLTYSLKYEWFNRELLNNVRADLKAKYNYSEEEVGKLLSNGGLKIYSTMDKDLQEYAENVIYNMSEYVDVSSSKDTNGMMQPQAAVVVTDYKTGQVKAAVGGREEQDAMTINRAISPYVLKPTGSSIKPFTVYAPALDTGLYTPTSTVKDAPFSQSFLDKYNYTFQPQNDQLTYYGSITLQSALARSLNTIALDTVDKLGITTSVAYGEAFGFKYNNVSKSSIAAIALGQFNNDPEDLDGANPLMVAEAYGVFGNDGVRTESILYTKVLDRNGQVLLQKTPETQKVISNKTAYDMFKMMEATLKVNTSNVVLFDNMAISGKSGTSENNENLWFGGLTPYYSCAIWTGADVPTQIVSNSGVPLYGNNTSGHLWREIMKYAHRNLEYKTLTEPTVIDKPVTHVSENKEQTEQALHSNNTVKPSSNVQQQYEAARKEEEDRIIKEYKIIEEKRKVEAAKKAEEARAAEEKRRAEEAKKAEEDRKRLEEEKKKQEEEEKKKQEEEKNEQQQENPTSPQEHPQSDPNKPIVFN